MSTAPRRLGKYELLQQLGRGNVGDVWKGRDVALHRDVAVKILHSDLQADPHFMSHFTNEGQILVSLRHPNLIQVYETKIQRDAESNETIAYIANEYIEGYTLTDYLRGTSHRAAFPSIADIVYIFTNIGAAIDYAHQNGIIHGNIKPGNILLNKLNRSQFVAGEPMLADIGIAQIVGEHNNISSPQYISPEQAVGDPANKGSDIYALGVILYEICTGVAPFRNESSVAIMMQHINTLPTPPVLINPNIPAALSEVILRAMAKDSATRFSRASLLAAAVLDACSANPNQIHIQQKLSEESPAQRPYTSGVLQSILGVPQPPEYMPGYNSQPLQGQISRKLPAVTHPLTASEPFISGPFNNKILPSGPLNNAAPTSGPFITSGPLNSTAPTSGPFNKATPTSEPPQATTPIEFKETRAQPTTRKESYVIPETPTPNPKINMEADSNPGSQNTGNTMSRLTTPLASIKPPQSYDSPSKQISSYAQDTQTRPVTVPLRPTPPERAKGETQPFAQLPTHSKTTRGFLNLSDSPLYIVVISLLLLLLLVGGAIGGSLFLNKGTAATAPGQVFFQDDALGHNDQLRIEISNIANPPGGSGYAAWLQDTNNDATYLGTLPVNNGKISYLYTGNAKHENLLSFAQGILITTENAGSTPQNPGGHIVYQAAFNNMLLPHIKNLLYSTPGLPEKQAVTASMFETIKSINDKATSIADSLQNTHDVGLAQRQATRIIELIDGSAYAISSGDQSAKQAVLINTPVGLISSPKQTGYIDLLDKQLDDLKADAGNNPALAQHIENAKGAVVDLRDWVQKMRTYDVQILKAANLATPTITSIALQLKQEAANSYTGKTIPPDSSPKPTLGSAGAYQAYIETQYMATLDLKAP